MSQHNLTTCICKATIPESFPYCLENKGCLQYIIENEKHLFDNKIAPKIIEKYILSLPITVHKKLIQKEFIDINSLDDELKIKILGSDITPIDFLLPEIVINFPKNIKKLQKNKKMVEFAKEIRKKNFTKFIIENLDNLSEFWALFLYESRYHSIWKNINDSLVRSSYTPEKLLRLLDNLYRQNSTEYLKFYDILSSNQKLKREIYVIEDTISNLVSLKNKEFSISLEEKRKTENLENLSNHQLNAYSKHWFSGIKQALLKHPNIYRSSLEQIFESENNWNESKLHFKQIIIKDLYETNSENPQKISPQLNEIIRAIVKHSKVPKKILSISASNIDNDIRKLVVLSNNCSFQILKILKEDADDIVRKIAKFKLLIYEKERNLQKNINEVTENDSSASDKDKFSILLSPDQLEDFDD